MSCFCGQPVICMVRYMLVCPVLYVRGKYVHFCKVFVFMYGKVYVCLCDACFHDGMSIFCSVFIH